MKGTEGRSRPPGAEGFSLVEVLVMALILAFVLLSVITLFIFGIQWNAWGRDETVLATLAQRKMEQLRRVPPPDLFQSVCDGTDLDTFGGGNWHCLEDPAAIAGPVDPYDHWREVGVGDCWTGADYDADSLREEQYRWNYCVNEVVFGNCLPPEMGAACGPDATGPYMEAKKVVVEVCRRREHNLGERPRADALGVIHEGRPAHCVKLEMYR